MDIPKIVTYCGYGFISWFIGKVLLEIHTRKFPDGQQETTFMWILDHVLMWISIVFLVLGAAVSLAAYFVHFAEFSRHMNKWEQKERDAYMRGYDDAKNGRAFRLPPQY